ncbi:hypothetical protein Psta_4728 [Pirellula staleyi DSM 6068]|uniref:Uncharacterized protein n=1 Tax=Pirellula staleyi (strain ATCC 27377 / DSM 6068 / ICPB 4128) TaxID=530564 RepID=D2R838_PIRSD|nr:hypothetical protein Psta_4728 [Pirellula staleyi DSM 6068]
MPCDSPLVPDPVVGHQTKEKVAPPACYALEGSNG